MGFCKDAAGDTSLSLSVLVDVLTAMINAPVALLDGALLSAERFACKQLAELKKPLWKKMSQPRHAAGLWEVLPGSSCCLRGVKD